MEDRINMEGLPAIRAKMQAEREALEKLAGAYQAFALAEGLIMQAHLEGEAALALFCEAPDGGTASIDRAYSIHALLGALSGELAEALETGTRLINRLLDDG